MLNMKRYFFVLVSLTFLGCSSGVSNRGQMQNFKTVDTEASWIRQGEPIEFEKFYWYPQDDVEILLDSEMLLMGEHKGIKYFVDRTDVRPFNQLYTKFDAHKFRVYRRRDADDQVK